MRGRPAGFATLAVWLALAAAGCARGRIEGGVFRGGTYQVELPAGWEAAPDRRADLALSRRGAPGGMLVNATCEGREPQRDLDVLMRHLLFGLKERRIVERAHLSVNGQPAERALFEGRSDVEGTVRGEAYVVKGPRCVYDFLYVAPPESFEQGRPDFARFVESLTRR